MQPDERARFFATRFLEGVEHFNARRYWEAHESWEEIWLEAGDETHQFLQGLIQLTAAYHHVQRRTFSGALRLFDAALARLEPFPARLCGIDREPLVAAARHDRAQIAEARSADAHGGMATAEIPFEMPRMGLLEDWKTRIPDPW